MQQAVVMPGASRTEAATAIEVLRQRFGERLSTAASMREQHAHTTTYLPAQWPDAVLMVRSQDDVVEAVRICTDHRLPIIPFGTGTSLEGGVNAPQGGLSLDMTGMNRVLAVHAEDFDVSIEPGVTRSQLNAHLRDQGLFFPIDPGADASLGGMAATRASGTNAVRYGTMRDNVISLTAVMAGGRLVRTARRSRKSSAGYDLTRLMVGSEGTLGVITELTLKVHGIPEATAAAVCSFPDVGSACDATIMALQAGIPVARCELLSADTVQAINAYSGTGLPVSPLLLLEFHGSPAGVGEQAESFGAIAEDCGGSSFRWVTEPEERTRLWKARHDAYWAIRAATPGLSTLSTDVCVPISRLAECVRETEADIAAAGLYGPILGHVGDGNFHCALAFADDEAGRARARDICDRLAERALAMDGTCTGEHGIGQGKRAFMRAEHGEGVEVMAAIKAALDPLGLFNPGKVLPGA